MEAFPTLMKILFLHGWTSVPGGRKPTYLIQAGHAVVNPALDDRDFDVALQTAQSEYDRHQPDVIVGSSRGGAVAMNLDSADTPLVLLCPAWRKYGAARTVKANTVILHSVSDDVVPFADSEELVTNSGLAANALREVGDDHRLADPEPLKAMLEACLQSNQATELVDVEVYYLEMHGPSQRTVPQPRDELTVLYARTPSVPYYRFLYNAVGSDYHWLSRRKLSDDDLATLIQDPDNELHVLHVAGSPAGFAELDRRQKDEIELVQFGLISDFFGQGLGKWFLQWTIERVWSYSPRRFWLHTCTLDHAAALPTYRKAGFAIFKQETIRREL